MEAIQQQQQAAQQQQVQMQQMQQQHEEREVDGIRNLEEDLERRHVCGNQQGSMRLVRARELYSALARYTSSEASTIVKSVTGLEGHRGLVEASRELLLKNSGKIIQGAT